MEKYYYLLINIFTLSVPLLRSFEPRIKFLSRWKGLMLGIVISGTIFIIWDILFTKLGVWGFNKTYLTGIEIANLPIEEWLFFITVPYACIFIYEVANYFIKKDLLGSIAYPFSYLLIIVLFIFGFANLNKLYTGITFISTAVFLTLIVLFVKPNYLGRFFLAYFIALVPFLFVNGILTGSFIPGEIVWYNNEENLGIRIFTIPLEDTIYMLLLILMNISIYERWKKKNNANTF